MTPLNNLSLEVAAEVDIEDGELDPSDGSEDSRYAQPCLKDQPGEREPFPYRRESAPEGTRDAARDIAAADVETHDTTRDGARDVSHEVTLDEENLEMNQPKNHVDHFL